MAVVVTQFNDGVESGPELVIPALPGETDAGTLARKRKGARDKGWIVEPTSPKSFHAWKEYADGGTRTDAPYRRDRYFEIR